MTGQTKAGYALAALWVGGMGGLVYTTTPDGAQTSAPVSQDDATFMPAAGSTRTVADVPVQARPAAARQPVDFIVRFDDKIEAIDRCLNLRPNQLPDAQRVFSDWASDKEALNGMTLKKVKFSGEFILSWDAGSDAHPARAAIDDKLAKIRSLSSVRYADPDYTFQPEGAR